ncbi:transferase family hexapeptide repeat protein [Mucilaginibacter gracilis]|uniref:Transferase family hexapeptide repeat protein n=1 Tax=Mucilaginibacter gracilis TaxID=423350 RepID=A0A495J4K5_9SPHI|nr:acyltransferase [Mucilaginibacter gracilis]RKR83532.1 transferase family hexapeptide repeat protein [Mucilaginibacter gracilis]
MLKRYLNKMISTWKGFDYQIDKRVPMYYIILLVLNRCMMLVNGYLSGISNKGLFFLSRKAKVKARFKLKVGRSVSIADGCLIDALSEKGIRLGNNVAMGINTRIEGTGNLQVLGKGMRVGNNVGLGYDSFYGCSGGITIGDDTIIGNYVSFHSENHVFNSLEKPIRLQGVSHRGITIGKNCWIGAKVTVLDGVVMEDGCIIAAGAVLKAGVYGANNIYGGVPAKLIRYREEMEVYSGQ